MSEEAVAESAGGTGVKRFVACALMVRACGAGAVDVIWQQELPAPALTNGSAVEGSCGMEQGVRQVARAVSCCQQAATPASGCASRAAASARVKTLDILGNLPP